MSKLLKLKEWLTVEEAARHLTARLEEEVSVPDILRLGLDRRLVLSVNIVNGLDAHPGRRVSRDKAKVAHFPESPAEQRAAARPEDYRGRYVQVLMGFECGVDEVIDFDSRVVRIRGVYDLPMLAGERDVVEGMFQELAGGPPVDSMEMHGAFVSKGEEYFQLLVHDEDDDQLNGSWAHGQAIKDRIQIEGLRIH